MATEDKPEPAVACPASPEMNRYSRGGEPAKRSRSDCNDRAKRNDGPNRPAGDEVNVAPTCVAEAIVRWRARQRRDEQTDRSHDTGMDT
jgi:hypothetical protein